MSNDRSAPRASPPVRVRRAENALTLCVRRDADLTFLKTTRLLKTGRLTHLVLVRRRRGGGLLLTRALDLPTVDVNLGFASRAAIGVGVGELLRGELLSVEKQSARRDDRALRKRRRLSPHGPGHLGGDDRDDDERRRGVRQVVRDRGVEDDPHRATDPSRGGRPPGVAQKRERAQRDSLGGDADDEADSPRVHARRDEVRVDLGGARESRDGALEPALRRPDRGVGYRRLNVAARGNRRAVLLSPAL